MFQKLPTFSQDIEKLESLCITSKNTTRYSILMLTNTKHRIVMIHHQSYFWSSTQIKETKTEILSRCLYTCGQIATIHINLLLLLFFFKVYLFPTFKISFSKATKIPFEFLFFYSDPKSCCLPALAHSSWWTCSEVIQQGALSHQLCVEG